VSDGFYQRHQLGCLDTTHNNKMSRHQHDEQDSHHYILAGKKLAWLANPVIAVDKPQPPVDIREFDDLQDLESSKTDYNTQEIPRFEKVFQSPGTIHQGERTR
jgi:hypothetical protein